ncbi:MAG: ferritin-like domain-containing protein [Bacteroidota bacterium]
MRTTASSATANAEPAIPANDNQSKYQPSNDADMNTKLLDAGDGVMKLFTDAVKDLYWAENHLVKALPKMISSASATSLKNALSKHLEETIIHVDRLEQVFDMLGKKPQAKKCDAMEGLTKEGEGVIEDTDAGTPARDLGIIMASQKVEHYEISAYTGLSKIAEKLGLTDIAATLTETLAEEQIADETLAGIADTGISFSSNDSQ